MVLLQTLLLLIVHSNQSALLGSLHVIQMQAYYAVIIQSMEAVVLVRMNSVAGSSMCVKRLLCRS